MLAFLYELVTGHGLKLAAALALGALVGCCIARRVT
jgi:hypothetical protein